MQNVYIQRLVKMECLGSNYEMINLRSSFNQRYTDSFQCCIPLDARDTFVVQSAFERENKNEYEIHPCVIFVFNSIRNFKLKRTMNFYKYIFIFFAFRKKKKQIKHGAR